MVMKLWLVSQSENSDYDSYDSMVVAAETEDAARNTMPSQHESFGRDYGAWCSGPDKVQVELIGEATSHIKAGVIVASFNAG